MIVKSYLPIESLHDLRRGDIIRLKHSNLSFVVEHAPEDVEDDSDEPLCIVATRSMVVFNYKEILKLEK